MKITPVTFDVAEFKGPDNRERSPGLHVSAIIRDILNKSIKKGERRTDEEMSPNELKRMGTYRSLGFAWERVLQRSLVEEFASGACVRPGEFTLDGIYLSPDLINIETGHLEEWKCTWRSSRRAENLDAEFIEWMWQIKAYLKAVGYLICILRVFFVNGDYRDSGPKIMCWRLEFSQIELDENWMMITKHADRMRHGT